MTMQRAYPGATFAPTFTVPTGGTFSAIVTDALGRKVQASVAEASGTATLTVQPSAWTNSEAGVGRIHITRENAGVTSVEVSESYRVLSRPDPLAAADYG